MRIGELATRVGVSTDAVRFYERSGLLPRPARRANDYRDYGESDVEHLRLLMDLRRLEIPLDRAAQIAAWCHSGHCVDSSASLPPLIREQRAQIAGRIDDLRALDRRLASLERHLEGSRALPMVANGSPCCDAAAAVLDSVEGGCACCSSTVPGGVAS